MELFPGCFADKQDKETNSSKHISHRHYRGCV